MPNIPISYADKKKLYGNLKKLYQISPTAPSINKVVYSNFYEKEAYDTLKISK